VGGGGAGDCMDVELYTPTCSFTSFRSFLVFSSAAQPPAMAANMVAKAAVAATEVKVTSEHQAHVMVKANKRAMALIEKFKVHDEPIALDIDTVGVSKYNRGGQEPNMQYVHQDLCANVKLDGFNPHRLTPGIVVVLKSAKLLDELVAHNQRLQVGSSAYPPLFPQKLKHDCLGGNHLTLATRIFKHGMKSTITGDVYNLTQVLDKDLVNTCEQGLKYWVLDEGIYDNTDDLVFLSEWKNADNNQNQMNSEMQLLKHAQQELRIELERNKLAKTTVVTAKVMQKSMVKLKADNVVNAVSFVHSIGGGQDPASLSLTARCRVGLLRRRRRSLLVLCTHMYERARKRPDGGSCCLRRIAQRRYVM
jgi:hypothetical protein